MSAQKIGQLVYKTHSTVQYIVNKFKYTESIKNEPRKPKRRILSDRQQRYVLDKIRKNPRLSAPKLRGIIENTTRKTMCNQTIRRVLLMQLMTFMIEQSNKKRRFVSERNREDRV